MPSRVFPKEGVVDYAHLAITECDIETCRHNGRKEHYHTLNPNGQAMKSVEMTVRRAVALIKEFDELVDRFGAEADYTAMTPASYNKALGSFNPLGMEIKELWDRYKTKALHQEVLDLAENIVLDDLAKASRKEILDGIRRIRKELDG